MATTTSTEASTLTLGVLHPGEMGVALARVAQAKGHRVLWASSGRAEQTRDRAHAAGLEDVTDIASMAQRAEVIVSICPPAAADDVARQVLEASFAGLFVDANAIQPETARRHAAWFADSTASYLDASVIGPPPSPGRRTALYACGEQTDVLSAIFSDPSLELVVLDASIGAASAFKMAFGSYTKGLASLAAVTQALAASFDLDEQLRAELDRTLPGVTATFDKARKNVATKGWRWIAEMEDVAATLRGAGLPGGIHTTAAHVFGAFERGTDPDAVTAARLVEALRALPAEDR